MRRFAFFSKRPQNGDADIPFLRTSAAERPEMDDLALANQH
jgi:hypothetical protein